MPRAEQQVHSSIHVTIMFATTLTTQQTERFALALYLPGLKAEVSREY